jgi:hypothetical protein
MMEPLKPQIKEKILDAIPDANPEEIQEYERLLAERFTVDPDLATAPDALDAHDAREKRLEELHKKLFP